MEENIKDELITDEVESPISEEVSEEKHEPSKKSKQNKLENKILDLEKQLVESKDKLLRSQAESINFKKRLLAEQEQDIKYSKLDLISKLIPNLDLLDKFTSGTTDDSKLNGFLYGFKMISDNLLKTLQEDGLKSIDTLNKEFDPKIHYALDKIKDESKPDLIIIEEKQRGYLYKDRVLQVAKVIINDLSLVELSTVEIQLKDEIVKSVKLFTTKEEDSSFLHIVNNEYDENILKSELTKNGYIVHKQNIIINN
jgi:molecular chaperone GrpE